VQRGRLLSPRIWPRSWTTRRGAGKTSVSEIVRQLIAKGLSGTPEKPREIPWAGLFHDPDMISGDRVEEALETWADDIDRDRG
jgi:predicted GTPase